MLGQSLSASSYTLNCNIADCQLQALLCSMCEGFFYSFFKTAFEMLLKKKSYIFNHIVFKGLGQKQIILKYVLFFFPESAYVETLRYFVC